MKNKILKLFFAILLSLTLLSCKKEEDCIGEPISITAPLSISIYNSEGVNLIKELGRNVEQKASVLKEDGSAANASINLNNGGTILLQIVDYQEEPNGKITKTFYLKLPDSLGNPNSDIDTLKFNYELIYQEDKCYPIWFSSYKVFYNDSLYYEGERISSILFYKK